MSAFTANASQSTKEQDVSSGAFWPVIDMAALRGAIRLTGDVTPDRLRAAVVAALMDVNGELVDLQQRLQADGHTNLADAPAPVIDGKSQRVQLYLSAVHYATAIKVNERFRSYDATAQGNQRADDLTPTIDELRRDLRYAISDLLGTRRVTVELI